MELDGCFPEVPEILTDEQYFSKVEFDEHLLSTFNLYERDGTYYWPINSKQGYIQKGRFRPSDPRKEEKLEWAIVYERKPEMPGTIFVNFGDLLLYIPVIDRRRWKKYFRKIASPPKYAEALLFFEDQDELNAVKEYWHRLGEESHLPWFTSQEYEQVFHELRHLKSYDKENDLWLDLQVFEFTTDVLDKYRDNELCDIHDNYIAFLRNDKRESASEVMFVPKDDGSKLTVLAKDFAYVPPREIRHWLEHQTNAIRME